MDKGVKKTEDTPCFYAALIVCLPVSTAMSEFFACLGANCLYKQYDDFLEVTICEVKNIVSWEVSEVLEVLFERCNIEKVAFAKEAYGGTAFIDISFVHWEKYPALIFEGNAMRIIHKLQAEIGIDPY